MEATLAVLNDLVTRGVIQKYAIGGAVAAIFWVEPFDTIDLDVFVLLSSPVPPLEPLRNVFDHLKARGYPFDGEFLMIEGVPVQFLPADDPKGLNEAALEAAVSVHYQGAHQVVETRVLTPEYLIAIALNVKRSKDYDRVSRLLGETTVNRLLVEQLIARFELRQSWEVFLRRYPEFAP